MNEATSLDDKFEDGWLTLSFDTGPVTAGTSARVGGSIGACAIFSVTSAIDIVGLVISGREVPLVRVECDDGSKEWIVREGHVDVLDSDFVVFYMQNNTKSPQDPRITYVARTPRRRVSA